ncbi:MAG TPA: efflux RND transporter periplasmic adaptor subunit [Pirellulaceae bacterium]|nr:efflux RND transporter periplasmic adaptor subunit [Pirellulaceae bacterium]
MRTFIVILVVLAVLAVGGVVGYRPAVDAWRKHSMPKWRTAEVTEGEIVETVNATGTVKPVLQVSVGSFVSGPILELYCEFNQEVKKDELLAKIDPRIYQAAVDGGRANLLTRQADVKRVEAQLAQARRDENRAQELRQEDSAFIAQAEIDRVTYGRMALEAQLDLAKAAVEQARFQLKRSEADLDYCEIRSPVDGIVINRKIDPGQTLAAQFQTPELFIVAPDMRKKMHVHASVDEADIGLISTAQKKSLPVSFTVDAYPDEFSGTIEEIRLSSTTTQNVVTYPVVVAAGNPDLKLLPGMTANISFEVDRCEEVLKIPNSALRFFPTPQHVRKEDRPILEGKVAADEEQEQVASETLSARDRAEARRDRNRHHVWVVDGYELRAVEVITGLSDSKYTQLVSGDLKAGDKLVTGIQPAMNGWGG